MPSLRQLRGRLRSIRSTQQIMRAMQLVSASKLKRSQDRLLQARAVVEFLDGLIERVLASTPGLSHPLCAARDGGPTALVVFTSDTGLCGSYNANLIQLAESYLRRPFDSAQGAVPSAVEGRRDSARATRIVAIGKKGHRYVAKRGYAVLESHLDLAGRPNPAKSEAIARSLMQRFLAGEVGAVTLLFSRFVSPMVYRPTLLQWLPIHISAQQSAHSTHGEYIFEPSAQRVFEDLMPRWALARFQAVMLEAFTSEHSARMIAMKNATDNAAELLDRLTLLRNKIRQATITKELSEIVGTAEALK